MYVTYTDIDLQQKHNLVDCKVFNPLNAELNPICHLLALAGAHHFVDINRIRVNNVLDFTL